MQFLIDVPDNYALDAELLFKQIKCITKIEIKKSKSVKKTNPKGIKISSLNVKSNSKTIQSNLFDEAKISEPQKKYVLKLAKKYKKHPELLIAEKDALVSIAK